MASRAAPSLRIAIGLSGGVDSAVTALLLCRCVRTTADVAALLRFGFADAPPPALTTLHTAVAEAQPLVTLLPHAVQHQLRVLACGERRQGCSSSDDAAVALYPFFMRNWHDDDSPHGWCIRSQRDYDDAQCVARALELLPDTASLPVLDFAEAYVEKCFQRMLRAYAAGHTLNVDVLCNSHIKYGAAAQALGVGRATPPSPLADESHEVPLQTVLATGHYARTWSVPRPATGSVQTASALLLQPCSAGRDLNDQTHFLSQVPPSALAGALFPLGHLFCSKADVRALARRTFTVGSSVGHIADKATSTGICFVGPPRAAVAASTSCTTRFASFLNEYISPPPPPSSAFSRECRTIFRDVSDQAEGVLLDSNALFDTLRADYPTHLPAFAVTLGQRVRLARAATDSNNIKKQRGKAEVRVQTYYVARKVYLSSSLQRDDGSLVVRLLSEVHVVNRWDHPLLFASCVSVASLRWWLPIAAVRYASVATCCDGTHYALSCLCALRHQMTPQPAVLRWAQERETPEPPGGDSGSSVRVDSCTICFETPVRAPAAGQAVVIYASLSAVVGMLTPPPVAVGETPPSVLQLSGDALAVIGSGWVAET